MIGKFSLLFACEVNSNLLFVVARYHLLLSLFAVVIRRWPTRWSSNCCATIRQSSPNISRDMSITQSQIWWFSCAPPTTSYTVRVTLQLHRQANHQAMRNDNRLAKVSFIRVVVILVIHHLKCTRFECFIDNHHALSYIPIAVKLQLVNDEKRINLIDIKRTNNKKERYSAIWPLRAMCRCAQRERERERKIIIAGGLIKKNSLIN